MKSKAPEKVNKSGISEPAKAEGELSFSQREISNAIEQNEQLDLSVTKTNWYFGEWQKLIQLDLNAVANNPDRAPVALLIASAHVQLGNDQSARQLTRLALEWGCSQRSVAKVLSAGVHNTLARVSALRGREEKAIQHFRASVDVVDSKSADLIAHARSVREMTRLGLLDQASSLIDRQVEQAEQRRNFESKRAMLSEIRGNQAVVKQALSKRTQLASAQKSDSGINTVNIPEAYAAGERIVILVAGMRHSGSTALFNVLRVGIESMGIPFESGYTENFDIQGAQQREKGIFLLKTHEYRDDVAELADFVFTTKRDLRDTVASAVRRKFGLCELLNPMAYSKYNRQIWEVWQAFSDFEFQYERYMAHPVAELNEVFNAVGLVECDAEAIHQEITRLPTDQYNVTLLSPTHVTDPEHKLTYRDTLDPEQVSLISRNNARWLELNGYE